MRIARLSWLWLLLLTAACGSDRTPDVGLKFGQVAGQVRLDDADIAAGATVTAQDTGTTTTTDTDGRFTLKGVSPGAHTLVVRTPRYREASETVEVKASETASVTFVLQRERGGIEGTLQQDDGASAEGTSVELTGTSFQTQADAQGHFAFTDVPTGMYTLRVQRDGYGPQEQTVEVSVDTQSSVTLSLQRERGDVTGWLQLESGANAPGMTVLLVGTDFITRTDDEGRFTFEGVATGTYTLRAWRDGYVQHEQQVEVHASSQSSVTLTLLRERGNVAGRFQMEGGANASDIVVGLVDADLTDGTDLTVVTDAEGRFTFTGVPTGTYTLRARRDAYYPYEQQVEVLADAQASVSQTLTRERGTVEGTLYRAGGAVLADAEVLLVGTDFSTRTDARGTFSLLAVPTGTYTLRASRDAYVPYEQKVEVRAKAQTSVSGVLFLARGTAMGRVVLEDGESAAGITIYAYGKEENWGTTTDAEGRFNMNVLLPGTYKFLARKDHYVSPEVSVEVRLDAPSTVDLVLTRAGAPTPVLPKLAVQRGYLVLHGSGFGDKRGESRVSVGGIEVPEYYFWSDTLVQVRIPANVSPGVRDFVLKPGPAWRPAATVPLRVLRQQTLATSLGDWNLGVTPENLITSWGPAAPFGGRHPLFGDIVSVAMGESFGLALRADGTVIEWGEYASPRTPMPDGLSGVVAISAAGDIAAALLQDGTVVSWGGLQYDRTKVPEGLQDVVALSVSLHHTLALRSDGTVVAWGYDPTGTLNVPEGLSGVSAIAATGFSAVALKSDGTLQGWGSDAVDNGYTTVTDPVGLIDVRGGYGLLVALREDGSLRAWGRNDAGQASPPPELTGVADAMPMGVFNGVALKQDGTLAWWGADVDPSRLPPAGLVLRVAPR